ncbi:hypothetical protein Y1Q_0010486 [Alligator mississippiensis]|uniref:Uncharacterized protein n=1 Tax=Alligator mississippiensis TaxID=8496 RepID=A0A151ND47_ALLMI|nr:hypothetical protein Y1Q_0010486 [Alligator mississippiensis]
MSMEEGRFYVKELDWDTNDPYSVSDAGLLCDFGSEVDNDILATDWRTWTVSGFFPPLHMQVPPEATVMDQNVQGTEHFQHLLTLYDPIVPLC